MPKPTLAIITPTMRLGNLFPMWDSIASSVMPHFDIQWSIFIDADHVGGDLSVRSQLIFQLLSRAKNTSIGYVETASRGISGNPQRNDGIEAIKDCEYVYFFDDDTIIHPDWGMQMGIIASIRKDCAVVCTQLWPNGRVRLWPMPESMHVGGIDTAQFLLPCELIEDVRWEPYNYCADGVFFSTIYGRHPDKFIFARHAYCYYNYLRPT